MPSSRSHGAEVYRQQADRLRRQADDTQNLSLRINLFVMAQHYDALAVTEAPHDRRDTDQRLRSRFPPFD